MQSALPLPAPDPGEDEIELFRAWALYSRGLRGKTVKEYVRRLRAAARFLDAPLSVATAGELKAYVDTTVPSPSNRNEERSAWIAFFQSVVACGVREDNPGYELRRWRVRRGAPNPLEPAEAKALIDTAVGYSTMFGALVTVYLYGGLRLNELVPRRWMDVKPTGIRIEQKGGGVQFQPLPMPAREALAEWRLECPSVKWLWPSPRCSDAPIGHDWVYRKIRQLGDSAGIDGCRPHRLRHTYATELLKETGDITIVQRGLRQINIQNTIIYAEVVKTAVAEAVERIRY